jgi:hypothetical protein
MDSIHQSNQQNLPFPLLHSRPRRATPPRRCLNQDQVRLQALVSHSFLRHLQTRVALRLGGRLPPPFQPLLIPPPSDAHEWSLEDPRWQEESKRQLSQNGSLIPQPPLLRSLPLILHSACDRLRCLQCNFEVSLTLSIPYLPFSHHLIVCCHQILQFQDHEWDSQVDYMFFRNNVPNVEKLSVRLLSSQGTVAYCCQCTWRSIEVSLAFVNSLLDSCS